MQAHQQDDTMNMNIIQRKEQLKTLDRQYMHNMHIVKHTQKQMQSNNIGSKYMHNVHIKCTVMSNTILIFIQIFIVDSNMCCVDNLPEEHMVEQILFPVNSQHLLNTK